MYRMASGPILIWQAVHRIASHYIYATRPPVIPSLIPLQLPSPSPTTNALRFALPPFRLLKAQGSIHTLQLNQADAESTQ